MTSNSPDTTSAFGYDVYVSPAKPFVAQEPPRFGGEPTWSPTSSTLIFGRQDAVLVDALLTTSEALHLADWVEAHGKNLTTIYITHGHGDHFFGLSVLLSRFPGAHAVATPGTVEVMRLAAAPAAVARYFGPRFPNQLPEHIVIAEALDGPTITLEGAELIAVEAGHTDTINTTFLHVPALDLVVAGDVVYNDVHLFVA